MTKEVKEGLGELAAAAEQDHEVQMARAELYRLAKYAIKLHDMLKGVSEAEGLEGWVQSKITKAAADIGSVYHHLDYQEAETKMPGVAEARALPERGSRTKKNKKTNEYKESLLARLAEKAPPTDKGERLVKHIKKGYAKDGKLTDKEKSIAYATAWKAHNKK